jgi:hypothetical protein
VALAGTGKAVAPTIIRAAMPVRILLMRIPRVFGRSRVENA